MWLAPVFFFFFPFFLSFFSYIPRRNCVVKFIAANIALKMTFKLRSQTWFKPLRSDASLATCEASAVRKRLLYTKRPAQRVLTVSSQSLWHTKRPAQRVIVSNQRQLYTKRPAQCTSSLSAAEGSCL